MFYRLKGLLLFGICAACWAGLSACQPALRIPAQTATATGTPRPAPSHTPRPPSPTVTATASPSHTPSPTPTLEPAGCREPEADYRHVQVNGWTLNRRTYAMLQYAAVLYGGELDITGSGITQGSYHDNGPASFGTHLGGGAVDLSVMRKGTYTVLKDDIPALIAALRLAGFAAWLRQPDEVYPGSAIHIHAIAIGDKELSREARQQLDGKFGYFYGYTGIPVRSGTPSPDRHGGPVVCVWMRRLGYEDLRTGP